VRGKTGATDALPPYAAFARNDLDIDLQPGDAPVIQGQVLQMRREMKMVDEGEIIEEAVPDSEGPSPPNGSERR